MDDSGAIVLKFLFWLLLMGNAALFAYHQLYIDGAATDGREPARMDRQLNAERIRLVATPQESAPAAPQPTQGAAPDTEPEPAPEAEQDAVQGQSPAVVPAGAQQAVASAATQAPILACMEIGNFDEADASRFETRIASLALGGRMIRQALADPEPRHIVFIPPQGSREAADRKAEELRRLGVTDFYIIQNHPELRWGVSLGIFRAREAARTHLAALNQKGVRSARIGPYSALAGKLAYRLRQLDGNEIAALEAIRADFPQQRIRDCGADWR
jgi:hypothetical protein